MKNLSAVFSPTSSKRMNELVGFLLFISALLLLLALGSYSPRDPSLNTSAPPPEILAPHNWIGIVGAFGADLLLQFAGLAAFLLPVFLVLFSIRWFWSRQIESPRAKLAGALMLLTFVPALLGLLPWHWNWLHAVPIEGLLGRVLADSLVHYFNLAGAYIVAMAVIAAALYLSTAFSLTALRLWFPTRFAFAFAAWDRVQDWRQARAKARSQKELEKKRAVRPAVTAQLIPANRPRPVDSGSEQTKTGIERAAEEPAFTSISISGEAGARSLPDIASVAEVQVVARADSDQKAKTTMPKVAGAFKMPSSALLARPDDHNVIDEEELKSLAEILTKKYAEFEVHGQVVQINPGPVVTTFEFKPDAGIKYSRITSLTEDLCLAMKAESILVERMPGKSTVGIQVPNREREVIRLREIIESQQFVAAKSKLTLALGKDINGGITVAELAAMPHLLIAGSTGSGKSVALNAMLMSLLYKASPEELRLILVDPKRLELGVYEGLPHLYTPIITEAKLAANALRNAVREMERRLKLLAEKGVRNLDQYNRAIADNPPSLFDEEAERPLPYMVIVIDELADLMMLDQSNVEESITRLAQMARAVGIHLVLATQRPSVDVITGLIKANFPARISFRVATKVDSRTILDGNGAEALLGRGDMLYLPAGSGRMIRLHAPYVAEKEIAAVVEFWRTQGQAQYVEGFLEAPREEGTRGEVNGEGGGSEMDSGDDELYQNAVRLVLEFGKASTSLLQRRLRIGYGRAAHLIDLMEQDGIVGAPDGPKPREVLKRPDWLSEVEDALR
jgi:S-DNA-T family DNA segregation ATPase FtsK/SpoIIIE